MRLSDQSASPLNVLLRLLAHAVHHEEPEGSAANDDRGPEKP